MAVSRSFIRGLSSSTSSSLLRSCIAPSAAVASTSRQTLVSSGAAHFSHSAAPCSSKKPLDNIKLSAEHMEKLHDPNDVGHDLTGGDVGRHSKRTLSTFSMHDKVCVVTGAGRGLGNLMARTFIESGANQVAFLDLNAEDSQKAAQEAAEWFEQHGDVEKGQLDCIGLACDVSDEASVNDAFAHIHKRWGRIDAVVNSAGIVENFPAEDYPTAKYQKLMNINVNGAWFVANAAARHMIRDQTHGSIVLIASMSAQIVNSPQMQAPYNVSKAAAKHMAASLGVEWAKHNIRVNSLSPGYMATSLTKAVIEQDERGKALKAEWERRTPMGRMGDPEDLKGAVIFLASDASKFVMTDLVVDGGYCLI